MKAIYVASRASIPKRVEMWKKLRACGDFIITSTWIDEADPGQTDDFAELWVRIEKEIKNAEALLLYAERDDFPLKGALVETGMALALGKPVYVVLPGNFVDRHTLRPIGGWIRHPLVRYYESLDIALNDLLRA